MSLPDGAEYWWPSWALQKINANKNLKHKGQKNDAEKRKIIALRKKFKELNPHLTKGQRMAIVMQQGGYLKMEIKKYETK